MKKWLLGAAAVLLTVTLAGCAKTVATTSGGKITQDAFYESLKETDSGKQILQNMILEKVLDKEYGDKVSDKEVTKQVDVVKKQYGSQFTAVLKQNGYTLSKYKKQVKMQLELKEAVKANTTISEKDLKKAWKTWEPKITVQHILITAASTATDAEKAAAKAKAEEVITKLNAGEDFTKLAKEYSEDTGTKANGGKLDAFDSTDTSLDADFKKAAFALKQGEYSATPVETQFGYHVIKSIKNPGKGKMADHKKALEEIIITNRLSDSTTMTKVLGKVFKKGDISIKDKDLKDLLSAYTTSSSKASSTKASSSSK